MRQAWPPWAIAASFAAGLALGCAERQVGLEGDETDEMPACLVVWGYGYWDDGEGHALINEDGNSSTICACLTWDEQQELAIFGDMDSFIEHEINKRAFDECVRISALYDFDWDPCQEFYETGEWRNGLGFTFTEDSAYKNQEGLTCGDGSGGDELGCAAGDDHLAPAWLLILAGVFGLRRRGSEG